RHRPDRGGRAAPGTLPAAAGRPASAGRAAPGAGGPGRAGDPHGHAASMVGLAPRRVESLGSEAYVTTSVPVMPLDWWMVHTKGYVPGARLIAIVADWPAIIT